MKELINKKVSLRGTKSVLPRHMLFYEDAHLERVESSLASFLKAL
jgi:hypothetical protein